MPLNEEDKIKDYVRQVIVVREDLSMPRGKIAAMVAHAAMSFLTSKMRVAENEGWIPLTDVEVQWLTELDPGLELLNQKSFAKIVLAVKTEQELNEVAEKANIAGLHVEYVHDSGYSHNPAGTFTCVAIGPDMKSRLDPVTRELRILR